MNGKTIGQAMLLSVALAVIWTGPASADEPDDDAPARFDSKTDLISLHYDHAPDRDDGQSAAADRTILQTLFGGDWLERHVVAVSGAYGKNRPHFRRDSDAVMEAVWNDAGGWLAAHDHRRRVVGQLAGLWLQTLAEGGDVWVKEGGQSDLTADVVRLLRRAGVDADTTRRVHVVQHSNWNERQTTDADLAYTKKHTDYIRIKDANRFLNVKGGDDAFEASARKHPVFGAHWRAAFDYYNPDRRLDFSDTGELMRICGLGEVGIDEFR
ncbi:MAG: hypothetical protein ACOC8F_02635, partial [Planctomycetota bacterium]